MERIFWEGKLKLNKVDVMITVISYLDIWLCNFNVMFCKSAKTDSLAVGELETFLMVSTFLIFDIEFSTKNTGSEL